jgi:signal transduction histidine kinase
MIQSLRSRLILASLCWTAGLLLLMHLASVLLMHALPFMRQVDSTGPVIAGLALMVSGLWGARASLIPLLRLPERVAAVRKGEVNRIEGSYPAEVRPLIDSLNALLDDREKSIQRAYATAGDLAHGLKTPLALLAREAEAAAAGGNSELAETIAQQVRRMSGQVDYHLARARAAASGPARTARSMVAECAAGLVRTLEKLYAGRSLDISAWVPAEIRAPVPRHDLDEILGNVLDNACKWARTKVSLNVQRNESVLILTVDDDGPGLPAAVRLAVLERGVRLDEAAPGSGLGLSIVRDLTEHYGGSIALEDSKLGGLCARITLPAA